MSGLKSFLLFITLFFCSSSILTAQLGNVQRDQVIGGELFGENFILSYGVNIGIGTLPSNRNNFTYFDLGILLNGRYNFLVPDNNSAFGIDIAPEVGTYTNGSLANYLGFSLPLMLSYNFGLGSTYESDKRFGLAVKTGIELDLGPLIGDRIPDFKPIILIPVAQLDIRFLKRGRSNIRDLYFKYGFISNETDGPNFTVAVGGLYMID